MKMNGVPGQFDAFAFSASVYEDESMWTITPIGIVHRGGRHYWITSVGFYEGSKFVVRDVSTTSVRKVLSTGYEGC